MEQFEWKGKYYEYYRMNDGIRVRIQNYSKDKCPYELKKLRDEESPNFILADDLLCLCEGVIDLLMNENNEDSYVLPNGYVVTRPKDESSLREKFKEKFSSKPKDEANEISEKLNSLLHIIEVSSSYFKEDAELKQAQEMNSFLEDQLKEIQNRYKKLENAWKAYQKSVSIYRVPFVKIMEALSYYAGCVDSITYNDLYVALGNKKKQLTAGMQPSVWGGYMQAIESVPPFPEELLKEPDIPRDFQTDKVPKDDRICRLESLRKKIETAISSRNLKEISSVLSVCEDPKNKSLFEVGIKKRDTLHKEIKNIQTKNRELQNECSIYQKEAKKLCNQMKQHRLEWEYIGLLKKEIPVIHEIIDLSDVFLDNEQYVFQIGEHIRSTVSNHKCMDPELHFIWVFPTNELSVQPNAECVRSDFILGESDCPGLYFYYGAYDGIQNEPQNLKCIVPGKISGNRSI